MIDREGRLPRYALALMLLMVAAPLTAQGRVAGSAVGQVGQRQVRGQALGGVEPIARINSRVANRVESRIRNRIDQYYNPQANATTPFRVAGQQARTAGRPTRR